MKFITLFLVLFVSLSLSTQLAFADEMNMHDPEPTSEKAADMGMTDSEHKTIEMKAHQKYDASVKKAESEYAATLKNASKTKNPAITIAAAKKKLQKAKNDANALYKKEKNVDMKKAAKPAMKPVMKPKTKPAVPSMKPAPKKQEMNGKKPSIKKPMMKKMK